MRPEASQDAGDLRQPSGSQPFSTVVVRILFWIDNVIQTVIQNQHFTYYSQPKTVHRQSRTAPVGHHPGRPRSPTHAAVPSATRRAPSSTRRGPPATCRATPTGTAPGATSRPRPCRRPDLPTPRAASAPLAPADPADAVGRHRRTRKKRRRNVEEIYSSYSICRRPHAVGGGRRPRALAAFTVPPAFLSM